MSQIDECLQVLLLFKQNVIYMFYRNEKKKGNALSVGYFQLVIIFHEYKPVFLIST